MEKPSAKLNILKKIGFCAAVIVSAAAWLILSNVTGYGDARIYFFVNVAVFFCSLLLLFLDKEKYSKFWKWICLVYIVAIVGGFLYYFGARTNLFNYLKNLENLKKIILSTGNWGIVCFFVLTFLQVVILPIPAALTVIAGSIIYGPTLSFVISATATFCGSIVCFVLGRKLGKKLLYWLFDHEKVDKYAAILGKKGKIPFIVMMLLPFFPDDMICVSAGVTDMKLGFFALSVAITRTIYIFIVSFFGTGQIIPFTGWGIPVWIAIAAVCVGLSVYASKKIN